MVKSVFLVLYTSLLQSFCYFLSLSSSCMFSFFLCLNSTATKPTPIAFSWDHWPMFNCFLLKSCSFQFMISFSDMHFPLPNFQFLHFFLLTPIPLSNFFLLPVLSFSCLSFLFKWFLLARFPSSLNSLLLSLVSSYFFRFSWLLFAPKLISPSSSSLYLSMNSILNLLHPIFRPF